MAIKEQDKVFYEELANGDKVINLPVTRANNVEGLGRSANTAYVVGDVVYVDNNKKVALKCTQAGTTSNSELDVSTASIGGTITDGTVKWQVCNRTSDVTSVNGKTGDVVVGEIVDASINGKVITLTFADGTTKTLTTQDTDTVTNQYPNYSAGVSKSKDVQYTAETDGYLMVHAYHDAQKGGMQIIATINGKELDVKPSMVDWGSAQLYMPIKSGSTYKISCSATTLEIYFYPMG